VTRLLARFLRDLFCGPPKPKANPEQTAAIHLYSTHARRVRAVPTRRPVNRRRTS
jgi:hypothetical protein